MPNVERASEQGKSFISFADFAAVQPIAHHQVARFDIYHYFRRIGWASFFGLLAIIFLMINLFFGLLYLAQPGSIANMQPGSLLDAFFFSTSLVLASARVICTRQRSMRLPSRRAK